MKIAIYPKSNNGWVYSVLVTIPMAAAFASLLFYEWFGNESYLADAALEGAKVAAVYSGLVIIWKVALLGHLHQRPLAVSRLKIVAKAFFMNLVMIVGYLAWRFTSH